MSKLKPFIGQISHSLKWVILATVEAMRALFLSRFICCVFNYFDTWLKNANFRLGKKISKSPPSFDRSLSLINFIWCQNFTCMNKVVNAKKMNSCPLIITFKQNKAKNKKPLTTKYKILANHCPANPPLISTSQYAWNRHGALRASISL